MPKYTKEQINAVFNAIKSVNIVNLVMALTKLKKESNGQIDWGELKDESGLTPIYSASQSGSLISVLKRFGGNVNELDDNEETPLQFFAEKGDLLAVDVLIKSGAVVNYGSDKGWHASWTPLHFAAQSGHHKIINLLTKAEGMVDGFFIGQTPLHLAVLNGHYEAVIALIEAGANVDAATPKKEWSREVRGMSTINSYLKEQIGQTPLHFAAQIVNPNITKSLLAAGAKFDVQNKIGQTPLHIASYIADQEAVITALIEAGADVNIKDKDGLTPLLIAILNKNPKAIAALIGAKSDVHSRIEGGWFDGWTPLHVAAYTGNQEAITALKKAGADINAKNKDGKTPLDLLLSTPTTLLTPNQIEKMTDVDKEERIRELINTLERGGAINQSEFPELLKTITRFGTSDTQPFVINHIVPIFAEELKNNTTSLEGLWLFCAINDNSAVALADALKNNTTLKDCSLVATMITNRGARALADALKNNTTLQFLGLNYGHGIDQYYRYIDEEIINEINSYCERNKKIAKEKESAGESEEFPLIKKVATASSHIQENQKRVIETLKSLGAKTGIELEKEKAQEEEELPQPTQQPTARRKSSIFRAFDALSARLTKGDVAAQEAARIQQEMQKETARRLSLLRIQNESNAKRIEFIREALLVLKEDVEAVQNEVSAVEGIDPAQINDVVKVVQGSRDLLKHHTADLQEIAANHIEGRQNQSALQEALSDDKTQQYYLDVIRLLNGIYAASSSVYSGHVATSRSGNLGVFGSIIKMAGGFSPVAPGAIAAIGDLVKSLGVKIQEKNLKKFANLCASPADMDNIAKAVALALVQSGNTSVTGKEFALDVKKILQAVFDDKITSKHDLVDAFFQVVKGERMVIKAKEPVTLVGNVSGGVSDMANQYLANAGSKQSAPKAKPKTEEEIYSQVEERVNKQNFTKNLLDGVIIDVKTETKLISNLTQALSNEAKTNQNLCEYFFEKDQSIEKYAKMAENIQKILRSKEVGVITTNNTIDSSKIKDDVVGVVMKALVQKFADKLLERRVEEERGARPRSSSSSPEASKLQSEHQRG